MNTNQLERVLEADLGKLFLGVFPLDKLPQIVPYPSALIANLDPSHKPGSHWVAFYFDITGHGEHFCSYGRPPKGTRLHFLVTQSNQSYSWTKAELQGPLSVACGNYCCFYLHQKAHGYSTRKILDMFSQDKAKNDCMVVNWLNTRHKIDTKCHVFHIGIQGCTPLL